MFVKLGCWFGVERIQYKSKVVLSFTQEEQLDKNAVPRLSTRQDENGDCADGSVLTKISYVLWKGSTIFAPIETKEGPPCSATLFATERN